MSHTTALRLPSLAYDCVSCGKSCQEFQVELQPAELSLLQPLELTQELVREGYTPLVVSEKRAFLQKLDQGRCCYLSDQNLCRIHKDHGLSKKPRTCRLFPFATVPTPEGVYVGASFTCTAIATQAGRALAGRESEFAYLLEDMDFWVEPDSQWSLWGPQAVDWTNYRQIEDFCLGLWRDDPRFGMFDATRRLALAITRGDLSYLRGALPPPEQSVSSLRDLTLCWVPIMEREQDSSTLARALEEELPFYSQALRRPLALKRKLEPEPDWFVQQCSRYLEHALFRKDLLRAPNLLTRLCLLAAGRELLSLYSRASAEAKGDCLALDDFQEAVSVVEGRLLLHAHGLEQVAQQWTEAFVSRL